jgi:hypothetical protein
MGLDQLMRDFVSLFDQLGVPYAVMGGMAVRAYGIPRPTHDLDFTIILSRDRLQQLFEAAASAGYSIPPEYDAGWVDQVGGMPLVRARLYLADKAIDVDIFLAESRFQRELMDRRRKESVDGQTVWLVSPEDLILLKLIARRPRDLIDVADVFFMQGELDKEYMRRWANVLGVTELLEKALAEFPTDRP